MSQVNRTANGLEAHFHPVSHYNSPDDVLSDARLSTDEKRLILSSWAPDMYVVESQPTFHEVPGIPHKLRLDDILAALKRLDGDDDPPPRGRAGTAAASVQQTRLRRFRCQAEYFRQAGFDENRLAYGYPAHAPALDARSQCAAVSQAPNHPTDRHRTQFHKATARRRVARW